MNRFSTNVKRYRSIDAHGHILEWGANEQLPLDGCKSIDGTR